MMKYSNTSFATAALVLVAALLTITDASAQVRSNPAFRFGEADPLDPSAAEAYYGSSMVHTQGVAAGRSDEIRALAKSLNYKPDLIFEYVRDNVEYYPVFGLAKGALGATLDKSGSSFDQAHLLVELLDEAGLNGSAVTGINFEFGTLSLTDAAEILDWFGSNDAATICQILGNGGIPGTVSGGTNCVGMSGPATSVQFAHIWVTATVDGVATTFDPSYKSYQEILPLSVGGQDYRDAMGATCSNGEALNAGAPTTESSASGSPYSQHFGYAALETHLNQCSTALWDWLEQNGNAASLEEIVGAHRLIPRTDGATSLPIAQYNVSHPWTEIPDQYRMKFSLDVKYSIFGPYLLSVDLFADEVYGRRVALEPSGFLGSVVAGLPYVDPALCVSTEFFYTVQLMIDGVPVPGKGYQGACAPNLRGAYSKISVDAPYAASGGSYLDAEYETDMTIVTRAVLAFSLGQTSSEWSRYYTRALGLDRAAATFWRQGNSGDPEYEPPAQISSASRVGENSRYRMFAAWAEQFSRLGWLAGRVSDTQFQHHYTVGWSYGATFVNESVAIPASTQTEWTIREEATTLTLESAVSAALPPAGLSGAPLKRSLANLAASLEASVMEQQLDTTAPGGTAQKFRWGNLEVRPQPPFTVQVYYGVEPQGAFPVYHFSGQPDFSMLTSSGVLNCALSDFDCRLMESPIQQYLDDGYEVVAMGDGYLGPGLRCGATFQSGETTLCHPNLARGGAFIAFKPDYSDIAHVSFAGSRMSKGGAGGSTDPEDLRLVDIPTPADLLKEEEDNSFSHNVDLKTGQLTFAPGPVMTSGAGQFPYALSFSRTFESGEVGLTDPLWKNNWHMPLTLSGSGNEMLGASRGLFAAPSIAALVVLEGIYSSPIATAYDKINQETIGVLTAVWWTDKLTNNVASASFGGQTLQFVRKPATNDFTPADGGAARLVQSGARYQDLPAFLVQPNSPLHFTSLAWRTDNLSFTLTNPGQDTLEYEFWRAYYLNPWETDTNSLADRGEKSGFRAKSWVFPSNARIDLGYSGDACSVNSAETCTKPQLDFVANNVGRLLAFTGPSDDPTSVADGEGRTVSLSDASVTHPDGKVTTYAISQAGLGLPAYLDSVTEPGHSSPNHLFTYDVTARAVTYQNALGKIWTYRTAGGRRGSITDPLGGTATSYFNDRGSKVRSINKVGAETTAAFDGLGRVTERTFPEGNQVRAFYDDRSNLIRAEKISKTAEMLFTTATYHATWNKPASVTDFLGNVVDFTYGATGGSAGQVVSAEQPAVFDPVAGANARPTFTFTYNALGQPETATGADGMIARITYYPLGQELGAGLPASVIVDEGGLGLTSWFTYDVFGNRLSVTDPLGSTAVFTPSQPAVCGEWNPEPPFNCIFTIPAVPAGWTTSDHTTTTSYDTVRRPLVETDALDGQLHHIYDAFGRQNRTRAYDPANNFLQATYKTYTATGQEDLVYNPYDPADCTDSDDPTTCTPYQGVTDFDYDDAGRLLTATDPEGRITKNIYNADGSVDKIIRALGTALQQDYATYTYTLNGQQATVMDANRNRTDYVFDGFDRLIRTDFPSKTAVDPLGVSINAPDLTDFEAFTYDDNGNVLTKTTRKGDVIASAYDALGRVTSKTPGLETAVAYEYDLMGRQTEVKFADGSYVITHGYDSAGRLTSTNDDGRLLTYAHDAAGNRTEIHYPGGANTGADDFWVAYFYDALNRVTAITERGEDPLVGYLATYSYDPLFRRTALSLGNGRTTTYAYEPDSALDVLDHRDTGGLTTASWTFDYNLANQVTSKLVSDAAYIHAIPLDKNESYEAAGDPTWAANGLNQYGVIRQGGVSFNLSYDANGSLTGDGTWVYGYDVENRLTTATGPGVAATYDYDPLGRRAAKSGTGLAPEEYLSDGVEEITDHDGAGNILRRYIHGPGVDEPVMMVSYDAGSGAGTARQYYHADYAGSIIAMSDGATGVIDDIYTYSAYGEVNDAGGNPFRYTGRRLDAETGLYYYRARYYSSALGRFLQTDPIGYGDNMNMYAYVGNDPVNARDPSGEFLVSGAILVGGCALNPACRAAVGGVIGAVVGGIANAVSEFTDNEKGFNGTRFGTRTAVDAVTGAAIGVRPDKAVAIGAVGGAVKEVLTDAVEGDLSGGTVINAVNGAALGAIGAKFGGAAGAGKPFPVNETTSSTVGAVVSGVLADPVSEFSDPFKEPMNIVPAETVDTCDLIGSQNPAC